MKIILNMKKNILILLSIVLFNFNGMADITLNEPITIPTPNTTAIAQYGVIPMSLYTGKANVNISLYDCTFRGINLNASLLYDTSGLLVNSLPSWTGHSWTLDVGGVITRTVKGYPDEFDSTNHNMNGGQLWQNYFHRYNGNVNDSEECFGDYMPDIFYFHFMGKSGKFFLGNDGEWKVASDDNLMVEFNINDTSNYITPFIEVLPNKLYRQPKSIKGFTIVDQEGNRYVFGGSKQQNASEYSIDFREDNDGGNNGNAHAEMYANSWYLTAVYDRFGKMAYSFEYTRGMFLITSSICYQQIIPKMMINSPVYLTKVTAYDGTSMEFIQDSQIFTSTDFFYRLYNGKSLETLYNELENYQIGTNRSHSFIYLTDNDYSMYHNPNNTNKEIDPLKSMGMSPLKEIRIYKQSVLCKKYVFNYNYGDSIRLHLRSVEIQDSNGVIDGEYKFKYNQFEKLPTIAGHCDYLTTSSDYWGYYNGTIGDHNVNPICSQYGMLTEIQYPTGGVTTFEYSNHFYNAYRNAYHDGMVSAITLPDSNGAEYRITGGLRVVRIMNYEDENKNQLLSEHSFVYQDGQLSTLPGILLIQDYYALGNIQPYIPVPMANVFGYHIGYSKVYETITSEKEIQKWYDYSNFSSYKEESCWGESLNYYKNNGNIAARVNEMMAAYDEWTQRDYMRGKLIRYSIRNEDDSEWSTTTYTYRTDSVNRESNYVIGYFDKSRSHFCESDSTIGRSVSYRLFYSKYDVVSKTEKIKYHYLGRYLTDVTTYDMNDYTISFSNGYGHTADMRLCNSETKSRLGNTVRNDYQYLFLGYYAPVVSTKEFKNNTFIKDSQIEYGNFYINGTVVKLPQKEKIVYPSQETSVLKNYTQYNNSYLPVAYLNKTHQSITLEWDSCDRLLSYSIDNQTTSCEYNNYGLVSKITQPNGYELHYEYDDMQRLSGVKDKNGSYTNKYKYSYRTGVHE